jgi:hypothetical protein
MEWTVRYFVNMRGKWVSISGAGINGINTGTGTGSSSQTITAVSPGSIAYSNRKKAVWEELVKKSDSIFINLNPAYQSPL